MTGFEFRPDSLYPTGVARARSRALRRVHAGTEFPRGAKGLPGHACVGADRLPGPRRHPAQHRRSEGRAGGGGRRGRLPHRGGAGEHGLRRVRRVLRRRARRTCSPSPTRCARSTWRSSTPVSCCRSTTRCSPTCTTTWCQQGGAERYRRWAELRIEALNHALRGIPEDRVRYHICFGSWHVPHVADAPLDAIVRPDAAGERRRLLDRGRQRAPRARVARVADR